ncbi:hypothetical protein BC939DRAFT_526701 [Gamsiella multidivaricata]|uniref:uncharacterized protein n=1 Tax=Gamsiella multidivaricata TaxID=101098 RepID=UPI002220AE30|nr:uncharacterized protein BC939DRAFT_526701 [Gamsiella multidivaricata]KAI7828614.1 hypothetical protein BC939DRAFT_526701 [Gamsiella multidivaricata]
MIFQSANMNVSQTYNEHPSTTSNYRSEYEASYASFDRHSSPSPQPSSSPSPSSWARSSFVDAGSRHEDVLHTVLGSPGATKTTTYSVAHLRNHHRHDQSDGFSHKLHSYHGSTTRLPSSAYRSSPYGAPRSSNRLPSVIDRIKTDLKTPNRSTASLSSLDYQQQHQSAYNSSLSPHPMHPNKVRFEDGPLQPLPTPALFSAKCQRAYLGQRSQMKKSFDRLQQIDSGKVEYRTIAFCTHLTASRWEPAAPSETTPTSVAATSDGNASAATSSPSSSKNDPAHAARLMSLANYIRHILSLTAGIPSAQPQVNAMQQQHQQQQQEQQEQARATDHSSSAHSRPSAVSSGPGPIKSESSRRHRYSPDYHRYPAQRNTHQIEQPGNRSSAKQNYSREPSTQLQWDDHSLREGNQDCEQHGANLAMSQFHPQPYPPRSHHASPQPNLTIAWATHNPPAPARSLPPLLRIPYPNLTLTLALIYVDRLKAKHPEARGEPGCSHRLFLVAFIIAAKYRCSVELAPPGPENQGEEGEDGQDRGGRPDEISTDGPFFTDAATSEQTLEAELIFSNSAWVRLLNLGSFYRQPQSTTAPDAATARSTTTSPTSPAQSGSDHAQTRQSQPPSQSPPSSSANGTQPPSISSIIQPVPSSSPGGMLQVEDLDRMEAEFLTFLNFDLATMSHDLETCWNLLAGKKITTSQAAM